MGGEIEAHRDAFQKMMDDVFGLYNDSKKLIQAVRHVNGLIEAETGTLISVLH